MGISKPQQIIYSEYATEAQAQRNEPSVRFDLGEKILNQGWTFVNHPQSKFSTGANTCELYVFFSWEHLNTSRKWLFALGHEARHTHQESLINAATSIVTSAKRQKLAQEIVKNYPYLKNEIQELLTLVNQGPQDLPAKFAESVKDFSEHYPTPLGNIFPLTGWEYLRNPFLQEFPNIFKLIEALAEKTAWISALSLDKSYEQYSRGVIQCGFKNMGERISLMYPALQYNDQMRQTNYHTRWLKDLK